MYTLGASLGAAWLGELFEHPLASLPSMPAYDKRATQYFTRYRLVRENFAEPRSLFDISVRDEAKEVWPDARPQARKTGGVLAGIHRGLFRAEHDADGRRSFAAVERSMSDRLLVRICAGED
jgi:hypothetical protein